MSVCALSQAALCQFGALRQDTLCQLVVCAVSGKEANKMIIGH